MNPNKALWEKGDFTKIAAAMRESGEELVESLGVKAGLDILDLGCGDGTTAVPAAQRGANVLGVDIAVAKEMVRVTRSAGRIVMGNWIPGDPTLIAQVLKTSAAYTPPPPEGFISPVTWGVEDNVRERFGAAGVPAANIVCERATYVFRCPAPPRELLQTFKQYYGPTMNAFEAASKDGRADQLETELTQLFEQHNRAGADRTEIPATFLKVTVTKP